MEKQVWGGWWAQNGGGFNLPFNLQSTGGSGSAANQTPAAPVNPLQSLANNWLQHDSPPVPAAVRSHAPLALRQHSLRTLPNGPDSATHSALF